MITKRSETVIITTVYKKIKRYIPIFINSLKKQTIKDFDIIIANDGVSHLENIITQSRLNIEIIKSLSEPIKTRKKVIKYALKHKYKNIIFADADDVCQNNRVEVIKKLLSHNQVVVNDINIINNKGLTKHKKYFTHKFNNKKRLNYKNISDSNVFGLTNTAAVSQVFKDFNFLSNEKIIAFDWYLWTHVLLKGNKAIFTNETTTNYRVYNKNIIGFPVNINNKNFEFGLDVKLHHYKCLKKYNSFYEILFNKIKLIKTESKNKQWRRKYINILNKNLSKKQLWWEFISISI